MKFAETALPGAYLVELDERSDERGFFARVFCEKEFGERGLPGHFVQVNTSLSVRAGTLRGLHYQLAPHAESKLLRCIRGAIWDVILDLRAGSPTFGKSFGAELTADNRKMMYVPKGFAHGFLTLQDQTEVIYFVDEFYSPTRERCIRWDDPRFGIDWPFPPQVVSDRDAGQADFDRDWHLDA